VSRWCSAVSAVPALALVGWASGRLTTSRLLTACLATASGQPRQTERRKLRTKQQRDAGLGTRMKGGNPNPKLLKGALARSKGGREIGVFAGRQNGSEKRHLMD
jgi:hypothetical protein